MLQEIIFKERNTFSNSEIHEMQKAQNIDMLGCAF